MSLYGILCLSHSTEMPDGKVQLSCTVVFLPVLDKVGCIGINSQSFRRYTYKKYAYKKHAYKKHLQKFTLNWAVLRILSVGCFLDRSVTVQRHVVNSLVGFQLLFCGECFTTVSQVQLTKHSKSEKISGVYFSGQRNWRKKCINGDDKFSRQLYVNYENANNFGVK